MTWHETYFPLHQSSLSATTEEIQIKLLDITFNSGTKSGNQIPHIELIYNKIKIKNTWISFRGIWQRYFTFRNINEFFISEFFWHLNVKGGSSPVVKPGCYYTICVLSIDLVIRQFLIWNGFCLQIDRYGIEISELGWLHKQ